MKAGLEAAKSSPLPYAPCPKPGCAVIVIPLHPKGKKHYNSEQKIWNLTCVYCDGAFSVSEEQIKKRKFPLQWLKREYPDHRQRLSYSSF